MFVSNTPAWEMEKSKLSVTWILCINVALMVIFSFAATSMGDAAKSKPIVGFGGLVSALLATVGPIFNISNLPSLLCLVS